MSEPADTSGDAPVIEAETEAPDAIEAEALSMGWKPKDTFNGPDEKFVEAAEFVRRGKEILPLLQRELTKRDREIEGLKKANAAAIQHMSRAEERAYAQARRDLEAELEAAATAGNAADVRAITKDLVDLERSVQPAPKADGPPPEFQAWMDENPWYGTDKVMSAACDAIGQEVFDEGYTGKAQIAEVNKRIREAFPEKFKPATNPNRQLPGAVEAGGNARRTGRGFSDLPADAQAMCLDFEKTIKGFKREQYVKTYFEGQAK